MHKICLSLLGIWILTACSTTQPSSRNDLPIEVPSAWSTQPEMEGELPEGWIKDFNSPQLTELIHTGLKNNYDLQATAARLSILNAEVTIAGADQLPQFSANFAGQRERRNFIGFPDGFGGEEEVINNTTNSFNAFLLFIFFISVVFFHFFSALLLALFTFFCVKINAIYIFTCNFNGK